MRKFFSRLWVAAVLFLFGLPGAARAGDFGDWFGDCCGEDEKKAFVM
jgi:hypothetical protein